ncbi:MAG: helix-turn-helix domain-containing protein [Verrucomicrobia bacterium]|nr:helix-turn-helix domain-containing protein [Verrucomicrobiota bacterium]
MEIYSGRVKVRVDRGDGWRQLTALEAVRRQQAAFACATGLPVTLLPAGTTRECGSATQIDGIFCGEGCLGERGGQRCHRMLRNAERRSVCISKPVQFRCPTGLIKIIVPVIAGERHIGNLLAGPFSLEALSVGYLGRLTKRLKKWGLGNRVAGLRASWRYSPILTTERGRAVATLLNMFAQYLAEQGQRLLLREASRTSPLLQKIEAYLAENREAPISLKEISQRVHLSPCYFCKLFRKQTGLTLTEYRLQWRIERAKQLLLNQQLRISEAAFEAGFESIPYFNRAFRRHAGCSPSQYRVGAMGKNEDKKLTTQA